MRNEMSIVFISILKYLSIKNGRKETTKQNNRSTNKNLTTLLDYLNTTTPSRGSEKKNLTHPSWMKGETKH